MFYKKTSISGSQKPDFNSYRFIHLFFRHFSTPDDILCYVAALPNVTIEKYNKIDVMTDAETIPPTTEEMNRNDVDNAHVTTTSPVDQSSSVVHASSTDVPSMEVDSPPISNQGRFWAIFCFKFNNLK